MVLFQLLSTAARVVAPRVITLGRFIAPRVATLGAKIISQPIKTLGLLSGGLLISGILKASPTARVSIKEFPAKVFTFGEEIGEKIEEKEPEDIPTLGEGLTQAGLAGLIAAGVLAAVKGIKDKDKKEKVLQQEDVLKATPIEDVGLVTEKPTLGAVAPKKDIVAREKPLTIRNTFNPEINISFSKSRRFINQQVLFN